MSVDTDFLDDKDVEIAFLKNRVDEAVEVGTKLREMLDAVTITNSGWAERAIQAEQENKQLKKKIDAYQDVRETLQHVANTQ